MKKAILIASLLIIKTFCFAQAPATSQSDIVFEKTSFDFGDIKQGQVVSTVFKFKNTGKEPLILSNVATSCGCTVPSWPKEPIAPGKSGEISATFNSAGKMGQINKVITVMSNAKSGQTQVSIVCNVLPADAPAATPQNQSVQPK